MSKPAFKVKINKDSNLKPLTARLCEFLLAKAFAENRKLEKAVWEKVAKSMTEAFLGKINQSARNRPVNRVAIRKLFKKRPYTEEELRVR